jgi:hypothetical protein
MSYLGQAALKNSELKRFDVTSSTSATHVLSWTAPNEQSLWITINGVKQQDDAYTIAGIPTTITLTDPLVATDKMEVIGVLDIGVITVVGDNSVSSNKLADNAVTTGKILDGTIVAGDLSALAVTNAKVATGIDAVKLADGTVTNAELQYINTLSSNAQTQLTTLDTGKGGLASDQTWTGSQRGTVVTDNDGSFDLDGGNNFFCTPAGNITLTFTNHTSGQSGYILFVNSGHTISLAATTKADANLTATLTTAGTYLVSYFDNGTNAYLTTSAVFA